MIVENGCVKKIQIEQRNGHTRRQFARRLSQLGTGIGKCCHRGDEARGEKRRTPNEGLSRIFDETCRFMPSFNVAIAHLLQSHYPALLLILSIRKMGQIASVTKAGSTEPARVATPAAASNEAKPKSRPTEARLTPPPSYMLAREPGGILLAQPLRPFTLRTHLRSAPPLAFPQQTQRLQNTIAARLVSDAQSRILSFDALHRNECPQGSQLAHLKQVIQLVNPSNPKGGSYDSDHDLLRLQRRERRGITLLMDLIDYAKDFQVSQLPLVGSAAKAKTALQQSAPPHSAPASELERLENLAWEQQRPFQIEPYDATAMHLGTEYWTMDRCGMQHRHEVQYWQKGDLFEATVRPTQWSQIGDYLKVVMKDEE